MKNLHIHITQNSHQLRRHNQRIRQLIRNATRRIDRKLPLKDIDIVVIDGLDYMNKSHQGATGITYYDRQIILVLDTAAEGFPDSVKGRLLSLLAHEIYHVIRLRSTRDETMFEMMVNEGLAIYFSHQISGQSNFSSSKQLFPHINLKQLYQIAQPRLHDKSFTLSEYYEWFNGSKQLGIPQQAAYALGCDVVKKYLDAHPGIMPTELCSTPATKFRPYLDVV